MSDLYVLAEDIASRGVRHIFGIPGSGSSLTLLDELEKRGVLFHLTHFEGTAVLMAGAVGRLTGHAGVATCIKGPGLANMVPGLAACHLDALPVVSISEAYPPGTPISKAHKRLNHESLTSAVTKGKRFFSKKGPQFSDLATWAESEVPGPVHLDIFETAIENDKHISQKKENKTTLLNSEKLIDLIGASKRPVIISGTFAFRKNLFQLLNRLSIPVFSVAAGKGVVDETLHHAAGVYTGVGLELSPEYSIIPNADLIIGIGLRHNEILGVKPFHCMAINVDPLGELHCSGFHFDDVFEASDSLIEMLFKALIDKSWGVEDLKKISDNMRNILLSGDFTPANAFDVFEQHFRHNARLVLDTGNFCTIGEHIWRVSRPEWYLSSGQGRYMGIGLPMAIAAALYDPSIPSVVFLGDGSIGMFIAEIKIAVKHRLPLIVVLMSDGFLGSIRKRSIREGLTEEPVRIYQTSWLKAMEGLGVNAVKANSEIEIENILKTWSISTGPLFIEIPFDPESYNKMVSNIR